MRTRDRPHLLARAVASVLAQEWQDWLLVIVNNGSPASIDAVVAKFGPDLRGRLQIVEASVEAGTPCLGRLCNTGVTASKSRWITLLDDDDTWDPAFLRRTMERLSTHRRHEDVRGVATQSMIIDEVLEGDTAVEKSRRVMNPGLIRVELLSLAAANLFTCNSFVYERSALEEVGGYFEELPVLDDWEFNLRFAARFDIDVIPEPLARYHRRPATAEGPAGNTGAELHSFWHTKIVNDYLRTDLRQGRTGLGWLMALASKLRSISEKASKAAKADGKSGKS